MVTHSQHISKLFGDNVADARGVCANGGQAWRWQWWLVADAPPVVVT